MSSRRSRVVTVSLPPELAEDFERIAAEEQRTRSELFREMLRTYRLQREAEEFDLLQRYGAERARSAGVLTEQEVIDLVAEERATYR